MRKEKRWFRKGFTSGSFYNKNWEGLYEQCLEFLNENKLRPEEVKSFLRWNEFGAHLDIFYFAEEEIK